MKKNTFQLPKRINEETKDYIKGSKERKEVIETYNSMFSEKIDIPLYIGEKEIFTKNKKNITPPHDHQKVVGTYSLCEETHVKDAIRSALDIKNEWTNTAWEDRASIFLKAAELIAGPYRSKINAATMIGQSKSIFQAEIDAACEFVDFLKFNIIYMSEIYKEQPITVGNVSNRLEYRPLEGFVYAITPFNFTAIGGNLCASAALMGNVILWKPSDHQIYSAKVIMDIFNEAGLPKGVINMVTGDPEMVTNIALENPNLSGIHFTGSTHVFKGLWSKVGENINIYKDYPRIVGETGGKDFIVSHPSSDSKVVSTAILRGAFEYQGQKCSAASRVYLPESKSDEILENLKTQIRTIKMGSPINFENFMTAVIHKNSFDKIVKYIKKAKNDEEAEILIGGDYDDSKGYFISPTVILTTNPNYITMTEEIFGPVVTIFIYPDKEWKDILKLVDKTSIYALTGAFISKDKESIDYALKHLRYSAGNFYINDKPSGAVVGQQPFGGSRASGTNDKAGSKLNLLRWVSPRLIKENLSPPTDYPYPYME
ncbi:MAG: L-glutamate gamma-semialdehyde dehydrogenase [Flavobacteriaceae bacterium]|jgi:1-pyrroline-5-carboxylate dehydrogenase|nr:L-glutamate gamma-semialdehyde dehydrogenase [Pelagibacterales bacterium]MBT4708708.1 L-glutamate gamma-semialdehyde dehydrogenase [Flavobacteriaceae bacterium]MBT4958610.1 L-glutamate gamma-semialdehyde dehydrogenase [Flavobacteriaceae bacterium]MBT6170389.1 L-glutamate gamma-semialdehyde dehydrogenase [Flavobacteriaceae bacterium]MDG1831237.1 L-glutamate gamma-semialdehyde dehydrogenase [Flavobacteriaceae bacterium]